LYGDKVYQDQKGSRGPKLIRTYIEEGLPVEAYLLKGEVFEKLPKLTPYRLFLVEKNESGEIFIYDVPNQRGVIEDISNFLKGHDQYLPANIFLKESKFVNGNMIYVNDNGDVKYYHESALKGFISIDRGCPGGS
jgi:hypothetical protein